TVLLHEDFECEPVGLQRTLDGLWHAGANDVCADSVACEPNMAWIEGSVFHDGNGNGLRDAAETGLAGWTVRVYSAGSLVDTAVTDALGRYAFGVAAGTYVVSEEVQAGWLQTAPLTAQYLLTLNAGDVSSQRDFGNRQCIALSTCIDSCVAGRKDNFDTSDGAEPTPVSAALDSALASCDRFPEFDKAVVSRCIGVSFSSADTCMTGCWGSGVVVGATLTIHVKATGGSAWNDGISLREDGSNTVWYQGFSSLLSDLTGGADNKWSQGDTATFVLDLANLRPWNGVTNALATLQDGDLDIKISNVTAIDWAELVVHTCVPNEAVLAGTVYDDQNSNGTRDVGEPGLAGWTVRLARNGNVMATTTTNATGDYSFTVAPGTYYISEQPQSGWVPTAPANAHYVQSVAAGDQITGLDFGNHAVTCTVPACSEQCLAGRKDNFDATDGSEPTPTSAALLAALQTCNRLDQFDISSANRCIGISFSRTDPCMTGCWGAGTVVGATLTIRVRADGYNADNDGISLREDGTNQVWYQRFGTLQSIRTGGADTYWNPPDKATFVLDLANLPEFNGITNVLSTLQDGDLDIRIGDDTSIDWAELTVDVCDLRCATVPAGLRGWWSGDNTLADKSPYHNDAQFNVGGPGYGPGRVGNAFLYTGSPTEAAYVPHNASLDFGTASAPAIGNFSLDAWVYLNAAGGTHTLVSKMGTVAGYTSGFRWSIRNGVQEIELDSPTGSATFPDFGNAVPVGQWTHLAVAVDRTVPSAQFYIDGTPTGGAGLPTWAVASIDNSSDLQIGPLGGSGGMLDEVELFARKLSDSDVAAIAISGAAGKCPVAHVFVDCNGNGIDDIEDIRSGVGTDGNGNDQLDACESVDIRWTTAYALFPDSASIDTVIIRNTGGAQATGTIAASDTCGRFDVIQGAGPYTLAPGESLLVVIQFDPSQVGSNVCTISTGFPPGILCVAPIASPIVAPAFTWNAAWKGPHVAIRGRILAPGGVALGFVRRGRDGTSVDAGTTVTADDGTFEFVDRDVHFGESYSYDVSMHDELGRDLGTFRVTVAPPALRAALLPAHPNPFRGTTVLPLVVEHTGPVDLAVFDVAGRRVRTLVRGRMTAGPHEIRWDGRDERGHRVPAGVYFVRMAASGRTFTRKAVIMR
ncbi:MAG: T9SS C-terminal target domain-containing protein, partial [Planctomycetota bacterium]